MASETIITGELSDGVAGGRPEPELRVDSGREGKPGEGPGSSDPGGPAKATEIRDFPYFEFYPYGYLY
jgi:hypothetical protein